MDGWEHAYYLDFQNRRPDYMTAFLEHLANWDFGGEESGMIRPQSLSRLRGEG